MKTFCTNCTIRESRTFHVSFLKKDGDTIKTNTLFVTFNTPTPPKELKIGYYIVRVHLYIPNPLRCFHCQKFGHSKKFCKGPVTCWKCGSEGHDGSECTAEITHCLNCEGDHCASFKSCPILIQEKEIQRIKTEKGLSYGDARRLVTSSSSSPSSSVAPSYASAVKSVPKKVTMSVDCQSPLPWIGLQPSLRDASRLPSVITKTTGTGTSETTVRSNRKNSPATSENRATRSNNKAPTRKPDKKLNITRKILQLLTNLNLYRTWTKTWIPHTTIDRPGRSLVHAVGRRIFPQLNIANG